MSNLVELTVARPAPPTQNAEHVIAEAEMIECTNPLAAELMSAAFHTLAQMEKEAEAEYEKMKQPIRDAGRAVDAFWRPIRERIEHGKTVAAQKLTAYLQVEQRKRDALALKAREDARAQQERLAKEAAAREAQAREEAERLRREAEHHQKTGNSAAADEFNSRAEHAEMAGAQDAQLLLEQVQNTMPLDTPQVQKPAGITTVDRWEAECLDLEELVRAWLDGKAPRNLVGAIQPELNRLATALGSEFKVPGCVARRKTHIRRK